MGWESSHLILYAKLHSSRRQDTSNRCACLLCHERGDPIKDDPIKELRMCTSRLWVGRWNVWKKPGHPVDLLW